MVCLCEHWESDGVLLLYDEEWENNDDWEQNYEQNYEEYIKTENFDIYKDLYDLVEIRNFYDTNRNREIYDFEENGKKYIHIGYCKLAKARMEPWVDFCCPVKSDSVNNNCNKNGT